MTIQRTVVSVEEYAYAYEAATGAKPPYPTAIVSIQLDDGSSVWAYGDNETDAAEAVEKALIAKGGDPLLLQLNEADGRVA